MTAAEGCVSSDLCSDDIIQNSKCTVLKDWPAGVELTGETGRTDLKIVTATVVEGTCNDVGTYEEDFSGVVEGACIVGDESGSAKVYCDVGTNH